MTCSTLTRIAPARPEPESRSRPDQPRKVQADRAFEEGIRWFLAVSRRDVCQAA